jgi:DNA-binding MarR family transcriptional regulator
MTAARTSRVGSDTTESCTISINAIRRIVRALSTSARTAEATAGITGAQLLVLEKLRDARAHSLNDLADRTFTHQSTVSVVVERLVQRGLVARTRSESDARRIELTVTPAGRAVLRRAPPPAQSRLLEAMRSLPSTECRALARALTHIEKQMELDTEPVRLMFDDDASRSRTAARGGRRAGKTRTRRA